jgi:hypothetical protein
MPGNARQKVLSSNTLSTVAHSSEAQSHLPPLRKTKKKNVAKIKQTNLAVTILEYTTNQTDRGAITEIVGLAFVAPEGTLDLADRLGILVRGPRIDAGFHEFVASASWARLLRDMFRRGRGDRRTVGMEVARVFGPVVALPGLRDARAGRVLGECGFGDAIRGVGGFWSGGVGGPDVVEVIVGSLGLGTFAFGPTGPDGGRGAYDGNHPGTVADGGDAKVVLVGWVWTGGLLGGIQRRNK